MNRIALITGGGSGFGKGLARELVIAGWTVYAADKNVKAAKETAELGAIPLTMDVTRDESVKSGVEKIIHQQKRIDLLVANAGFGNFSSVEETSPEKVREIFEVNVFGVERCVREVLPHMRKQRSGRIIMTTSVVAHVSLVGLGWYSATKHAVKAVANALRQEVRHLGIFVSTVEPGTSKTGFGAIAFGLLEQGRTLREYDGVMRGLNKWLGGLYRISPGPNHTVYKLFEAATCLRPRAHYPVSWDVRMLKLIFYLAPRRWLDGFVLWLAKR
jgi:NAD(P)-dependent dehydrogenase (short-subunit alcohol dehydrogenase family)